MTAKDVKSRKRNVSIFYNSKQSEMDMERRNYTNKQIYASSVLELIFRMNCLHAMSKRMPEDAGVPYSDIWEASAIIKELRGRLGRIGIFYMEMKNER